MKCHEARSCLGRFIPRNRCAHPWALVIPQFSLFGSNRDLHLVGPISAHGPRPGGAIVRVLLAEDNAFYRRLLEATLLDWGYQVEAVADGGAAWERLQADNAPQIAILDWVMPG